MFFALSVACRRSPHCISQESLKVPWYLPAVEYCAVCIVTGLWRNILFIAPQYPVYKIEKALIAKNGTLLIADAAVPHEGSLCVSSSRRTTYVEPEQPKEAFSRSRSKSPKRSHSPERSYSGPFILLLSPPERYHAKSDKQVVSTKILLSFNTIRQSRSRS